MKKYEVMYIIRPEVEEEARNALIEEINNVFVGKASTVEKVSEWGLKELATRVNSSIASGVAFTFNNT